jgi:5-methylcytosine-specific restriction protein A
MPQIRIDDEVYRALQKQAEPFRDTPNDVLRRLLGLNDGSAIALKPPMPMAGESGQGGRRARSNSGRALNEQWGVGARDAKYHQPGTFFENLRAFPGALFDSNGYVLFETEDEYRRTPGLSHGQKLNVRKGISSLPGYVRRTE